MLFKLLIPCKTQQMSTVYDPGQYKKTFLIQILYVSGFVKLVSCPRFRKPIVILLFIQKSVLNNRNPKTCFSDCNLTADSVPYRTVKLSSAVYNNTILTIKMYTEAFSIFLLKNNKTGTHTNQIMVQLLKCKKHNTINHSGCVCMRMACGHTGGGVEDI